MFLERGKTCSLNFILLNVFYLDQPSFWLSTISQPKRISVDSEQQVKQGWFLPKKLVKENAMKKLFLPPPLNEDIDTTQNGQIYSF